MSPYSDKTKQESLKDLILITFDDDEAKFCRDIEPSCYQLFCTCAIWKKWQQNYIVVFSCYDLSITNKASCILELNVSKIYISINIFVRF